MDSWGEYRERVEGEQEMAEMREQLKEVCVAKRGQVRRRRKWRRRKQEDHTLIKRIN